jgi:hypothetical protein
MDDAPILSRYMAMGGQGVHTMTNNHTKMTAWSVAALAIALASLLVWLMTNVKPDQATRAAQVQKDCEARPAACKNAAKLRDQAAGL